MTLGMLVELDSLIWLDESVLVVEFDVGVTSKLDVVIVSLEL